MSKSLPVKLEDFHYFVSGSNPKAPWIVFLHGLLGSAANWRRIIPSFEAKYRVLIFDQRGHGRSFKPKTGYSPQDLAEDLGFLMDHLQVPRAHLVGHSQGGRVAVAFALAYRARVEKLVIEDIGPEASGLRGQELISLLRSVPVPFPSKKAAKEYFLNDLGNPQLGNFLYTDMDVGPDGKATWSVNLEAIVSTIDSGQKFFTYEKLAQLKCPTLLIRGGRSRDLPKEEFQKILKSNSLIQGVEIEGADHWVHFEKPEKFVSLVRAFLEK